MLFQLKWFVSVHLFSRRPYLEGHIFIYWLLPVQNLCGPDPREGGTLWGVLSQKCGVPRSLGWGCNRNRGGGLPSSLSRWNSAPASGTVVPKRLMNRAGDTAGSGCRADRSPWAGKGTLAWGSGLSQPGWAQATLQMHFPCSGPGGVAGGLWPRGPCGFRHHQHLRLGHNPTETDRNGRGRSCLPLAPGRSASASPAAHPG